MGFVTVKNFGIALGVKDVTVRQRILRKKLIKNKEGLIDVEDVTNFAYVLETNGGDLSVFDEYIVTPTNKTKVRKKVSPASETLTKVIINKNKVSIPAATVEIDEKSVYEKPSKTKGKMPTAHRVETTISKPEKPVKLSAKEATEQREAAKARKELLDYDMRQKKANAEYREREAELKKMQLEKIAGNTLPLDLTKKILKINCQAILVQFLSSVENMVSVTVEELGGVRADNVRITNELKKIFKKTVENCEKNAEREIENAVAEYSEVRSRGERK